MPRRSGRLTEPLSARALECSSRFDCGLPSGKLHPPDPAGPSHSAILLVFGVGSWAATAQLSGAVIAAGTLVVNTNVKKVQHPSGPGVSGRYPDS